MADRDLLALADAVGVLDPNTRYLRQLEQIDERDRVRRARLNNLAVGVLLCCILGIYITLTYTIGARA